MATQTVTLRLPDVVLERAQQAAEVLQHPLEEMLVAMLSAALPDVTDVPSERQAELARMTWLDDQTLWTIARRVMDEDQQLRLQQLSAAQAGRTLTADEQQALETLLQTYGQVTLSKARAYALLSLRGGTPLLA